MRQKLRLKGESGLPQGSNFVTISDVTNNFTVLVFVKTHAVSAERTRLGRTSEQALTVHRRPPPYDDAAMLISAVLQGTQRVDSDAILRVLIGKR